MARPLDTLALEAEFTRFLAARKFRKTPERFAILHKALSIDSHFGVEALHQAMETDGYHVSRATVYNTVEILHEAGILRRNLFDGSAATYEVRRDNHIHLICRSCGSIREVDDSGLAALVMSLHPDGFLPDSFALTVRGLCPACQSPKSG